MSAQGVLAATLIKPGQYELREYPLPEPGPGCVLVKMEMSGICGTDKHTFQGYVTQYGDRKLEFPIIQGHENVGTIAAIGGDGRYGDFRGVGGVGPGETDVRVSERVVPVRRHRGSDGRWAAGDVFFDEGADAGRGNDYCGGFVGVPAEFCEAAGSGSYD